MKSTLLAICLFSFFSVSGQNLFQLANEICLKVQRNDTVGFQPYLAKYLSPYQISSLYTYYGKDNNPFEGYIYNNPNLQKQIQDLVDSMTVQDKHETFLREAFLHDSSFMKSGNLDKEIYLSQYKQTNYGYQIEKLRNTVPAPKLPDFTGEVIPTPSTIIDGTAQFLVDRVKEELNTELIVRFREALSKTGDIQLILPATFDVIQMTDPLKFSLFSNQIQSAAQKDLSEIPQNAIPFLMKSGLLDNLNPNLKESILIGIRSIQYQKSGFHPSFTLSMLNQEFGYSIYKSQNINKVLSLTNSLSQAFFVPGSNTTIDYKTALIALQNPKFRRIFVALYAVSNEELLKQIRGTKAMNMFETLKVQTSIDQFSVFINEFYVHAGQISIELDSIRTSFNEEMKRDQFLKLCDGLIDYIDLGCRIYAHYSSTDEFDEDWNFIYKPILGGTIDTYKDLVEKKYVSALVSFNLVLDTLFTTRITSGCASADKFLRLQKNLSYWGGILATIADQEGEVDVESLLKTYAAPRGSYRIKRQTPFSFSLNAYPGLFAGGEFINDSSATIATGVTAPIGLSFNWALSKEGSASNFDSYKKTKANNIKFRRYTDGVLGLYIPVIDIAAPFVYRWSHDETNGFPDDLKWEHIFSPGAYVSYGFQNAGVTLMLGYQYKPALRKITSPENVEIVENAHQIGLSVTYDIPIFTFYNKKSKKRLVKIAQ